MNVLNISLTLIGLLSLGSRLTVSTDVSLFENVRAKGWPIAGPRNGTGTDVTDFHPG